MNKKVNISAIKSKMHFIYKDEREKNIAAIVIYNKDGKFFFDPEYKNEMSNLEVEALLLRGALVNRGDKYYRPSSFNENNVSFSDAVINPEDIEVDLSGYATKDELNAKADINDIPTKLSDLQNDSNFLTSIPSEYVTDTELNNKGYLTQHQSLDDYATKSYVSYEIAKAQLEGGEVDLDPYALKEDIPTKLSELQNDSNFLSSIPSEYITETELNNKDFASKSYVSSEISKVQLEGGGVDTSNLVNKCSFESEINSARCARSNYKPIRPLISFTDDDGKIGVYTKWKPIMQDKDIPITMAIITSSVGNSGFMTWEQILELKNDYGCEIMSHTVSHSNIGFHATNKSWIEELKQSKDVLQEHDIPVRGIAYPNGGMYGTQEGLVDGTSNGTWMTALFYDWAVTTQNKLNTSPLTSNFMIDRVSIGSYNPSDAETLDDWKRRVDECIENNGWLVFLTHIDDNGHSEEDTENLIALIDYIKEQQVDIVTVSEAFDIFGNIIETPECTITKQGGMSTVNVNVPPASADKAGIIRVGDGLTINDGVLSVDGAMYYNKSYLDDILDAIQNDIKFLKNNQGGSSGSESLPVISGLKSSFKEYIGNPVNITYNVLDSDGISVHEISYDNGATYSEITPIYDESSSSYSYDINLSEEAVYLCKLRVTDNLGYSSIKSFSITMEIQRIYFDKVTGEGAYDITLKDSGIVSITDGSNYSNVMFYYTNAAEIVSNTSNKYVICIKVLENNIIGTPNFEASAHWGLGLKPALSKKISDYEVGQTYRYVCDNITDTAMNDKTRMFYIQFGKTDTASSLKIQAWLEIE